MDFTTFIKKFEQSACAKSMKDTVEDSPWHREASVWIHTQMALATLRGRENEMSEHDYLLTQMAILFHDVGKPVSEETLTREDGVEYRRYAGHEQMSAVMFTEQYLTDPDLQAVMQPLGETGHRKVRWLIEHHLPYGLQKKDKLAALKRSTLKTVGSLFPLYAHLLADAEGRISDGHEEKLRNVHEWIKMMDSVHVDSLTPVNDDAQVCYVLMGPPGIGKSTWTKNSAGSSLHYSWDNIRLELLQLHHPQEFFVNFDNLQRQYDLAFEFCVSNQTLWNSASTKWNTMLRWAYQQKKNIVVDNTNQTVKARTLFIQSARKAGFRVVGVEFYASDKTLMERALSRKDKGINGKIVRRIRDNMRLGFYGSEFDDIITVYS